MPQPRRFSLHTGVLVAALYLVSSQAALAEWENLGGDIRSAPSCVSWGPKRIDCFAAGADGALHRIWWEDGDFTRWGAADWTWENLGGELATQPSCVSGHPDRIHCFARGTDDTLMHWWWNGVEWRWESLGGHIVSRPSCLAVSPTRFHCFARGADGSIYHAWWTGSRWRTDRPAPGATFAEGPDCLSRGPIRIDCFGLGADRSVRHVWWDGSAWRATARAGVAAPLATVPKCVSWHPSHIECFARGTDNALKRSGDPGDPTSWQNLAGVIRGEPSCVTWGPNHIDCFARGTDDAMWHIWWDGERWVGWERRGGRTRSAIECLSWRANRINCFARGTGTTLHHTAWNGCEWTDAPLDAVSGAFPTRDLVRIPAAPGDRDGDGLPDDWEEARRAWGLDPDRANLIVVVALRSNVARADVRRTLEGVKQFFARVPVTTGGFVGIDVVFRKANVLDETFRDDIEPLRYHADARALAMVDELLGRGHGMLFEMTGGCHGGGETTARDWSAGSSHWRTIVHELGHQLGLGHEPLSSPVQSPLYTSLMNYDYNGSFNDDRFAVHFSRGKFASVRLDERNLDETLPFHPRDLEFLSKGPYNFAIRPGPECSVRPEPGRPRPMCTTEVDFNRNGIPGETGVSADIDDGYALRLKESSRIGKTAGDIALAAVGSRLVVLTTELPGVDQLKFAGKGATPDSPGQLMYRIIEGDRLLARGALTSAPSMTGAPHALGVPHQNKLLVAFPSRGGFNIAKYALRSNGELAGEESVHFQSPADAFLFSTRLPGENGEAFVLLWNRDTGAIEARELPDWSPSNPRPARRLATLVDRRLITSNTPPAATYDTRNGRLLLLTTRTDGPRVNRLALWTLLLSGAGEWVGLEERWLEDGRARTTDRPAIVFDDRAVAGSRGRIIVYYREDDGGTNELKLMQFVRAIPPNRTGPDARDPFVFRRNIIYNEWTRTRNAPAAVAFGGDFVFAWRTREELDPPDPKLPPPNEVEIFYDGSGERASGMTDFDDVTYIATRGLRESLAAVRR